MPSHKRDLWGEIIEYHMEYNPLTDELEGDYEESWSSLYIAESVPQKPVDWLNFGIKDEIAKKLDEYLELLKKDLATKVDDFLKYKQDAIKSAIQLSNSNPHADDEDVVAHVCENINQEHGIANSADMWNHIPGMKSPYPYMKERITMGQTIFANVNKAFGSAIGKAMRHVERISKREHQMADRVERVNLFVTSLRRELGYVSDSVGSSAVSEAINSLCEKENWYDAGVMNLNVSHRCRYPKAEIQKWIDEANRQKSSTEAARYQIEGELEELERGLTGCLTAIEEAKRINQESEPLVAEMVGLFEVA